MMLALPASRYAGHIIVHQYIVNIAKLAYTRMQGYTSNGKNEARLGARFTSSFAAVMPLHTVASTPAAAVAAPPLREEQQCSSRWRPDQDLNAAKHWHPHLGNSRATQLNTSWGIML
jgi:hypothetical protein